MIGFSFPATAGAVQYKIDIAIGRYTSESDFEKNITTSVPGKKNKIIGEVPYFGSEYTWRSVSISKDKKVTKSGPHYFSTKITPDVDTNATRLRVIKHTAQYKDAYVFADGERVLYDMNGRPVWFLPGSDLEINKDAYPRDLKITPQSTITFIVLFQLYEINYDGKILWHYKSNAVHDEADTFHHEFTRLDNGHYMGMQFENKPIRIPLYKDSVAGNVADSARLYRKMKFSMIAEYDEHQRVVWQWDSYNYLKNSDLFAHKTADALYDLNDLHMNSFYFDEHSKVIYVSFRNVSRIIKIKYPEGTLLNEYGTVYKPGIKDINNDLFCWQHSCRLSKKGYLYLYNNNTCGADHIPTVVMFQEPGRGATELKKVWEYKCTIEDEQLAKAGNLLFYQGGNVLELPDESLFVSMGAPYCKIFIVNHDKEELWSAVPEKYNKASGKWEQPKELYRASIITNRKDLERLIWASEKLP